MKQCILIGSSSSKYLITYIFIKMAENNTNNNNIAEIVPSLWNNNNKTKRNDIKIKVSNMILVVMMNISIIILVMVLVQLLVAEHCH